MTRLPSAVGGVVRGAGRAYERRKPSLPMPVDPWRLEGLGTRHARACRRVGDLLDRLGLKAQG